MITLLLPLRKLRPREANKELGDRPGQALIPSVSEGLVLGSFCSHGPESCSWFKFCPRVVEEHQIPVRELSVHVHVCAHTPSHWSRSGKPGEKRELSQGLGNRQAQMPSTLTLLQDESCLLEDLPMHRVWVKSVRMSGKEAIFSLQSHSLGCAS